MAADPKEPSPYELADDEDELEACGDITSLPDDDG